MDERTREKRAYDLALQAQWQESPLYKAQAEQEEKRAIWAAHEANPTPETLKAVLHWREELHANAAQASQQGENLRLMVTDLEATVLSLYEREKATIEDTALAERYKRERGHYERTLEMTRAQSEIAQEMIEQVKQAVERMDALIEREKARVAALFPDGSPQDGGAVD